MLSWAESIKRYEMASFWWLLEQCFIESWDDSLFFGGGKDASEDKESNRRGIEVNLKVG